MKKILFIITNVLSICALSFGQQYEPFINESRQWTYVQTLFLTGNEADIYRVETCYFKGDTVWNDVKYSKFYKRQVLPSLATEQLSYFFREDTIEKKVYIHDFHFNKTALFYDFSLKKGDSFDIYVIDNLFHKDKVLNVDTIVTSSKKLKRIEFEDSIIWIEGLGSVTKSIIPSEGELICVKDGNTVLYLNSKFNSCDTVFQQGPYDAIQDKKIETLYRFYVYPNPIETSSVLKFNVSTNKTFKIEIYSSFGVLIKEDNFVDSFPIGLIPLGKGLYIYRLKYNNKIIGVDKLIVN